MSDSLFTYERAAEYLGKTKAAVKQMVYRKKTDNKVNIPPPIIKPGTPPYWIKSEFMAYYQKREVETRGRKRGRIKTVSSA